MGPDRRAQPVYGDTARRWATGLIGLACLMLAAPTGAAKRIPYPPVPMDGVVLPRPVPSDVSSRPAPRIAYPRLPRDEALAQAFAYDDLVEELPSEAEQQALGLQINDQTYRPNPAIWKIADRDTTIYLFGTIHVLPPGFVWRNAGVDRVVAESRTLIVESVDDSAGVQGLMAGTTPGDPRLPPLMSRVSRSHRAKLAQFVGTLPPEAATVMDGMPTWIAAVAVGFVRDYRAGNVPGPGADDWLEGAFRARGRRVEAIEDGARVLASVNAIPDAEQRRMLDLALDARQAGLAEMRAPLHAWARGDIGPQSALSVNMVATGASALDGPLLKDRNRAWAESLKQRLKTPGTMLFAAGAGHFVGPDSVIDLLGQQGVRVERVQ